MATPSTREKFTVEERIHRAAGRRAWYHPPWKPFNPLYYCWLSLWNSRGDWDRNPSGLAGIRPDKIRALMEANRPFLESAYSKASTIESRLLATRAAPLNRRGDTPNPPIP